MEKKRLVIIDGYSLLYRAFFATRFLSTSDGRPTNALFGFTSMLFGILEKEKPQAIVVALDAPGKTFRHTEFAEYKGTRRETQDELKVQLGAARELIKGLGVPAIEVVGYEADDVVGTISKKAEENGYDTTVVTGDLDSLQLIDDCIRILTPKQGMTETVTYDAEAVMARYGITPTQVPDFKALKGDTSDNIPGVPGIGDVGATALIQKYGTIENLIANIPTMEPKFQKKCLGLEDHMRRSLMLATIVREVPLEYNFAPFELTEPEFLAVTQFLESYEFKSLARRAPSVLAPYRIGLEANPQLKAASEVVQASVEFEAVEIKTQSELEKFVRDQEFAAYFPASPSKGLFEEGDRIGYLSVGGKVTKGPAAWIEQMVLSRPEKAILHDAKPIYRRAGQVGIDKIPKTTPRFDSLIAAFVLESNRSSYSLRDLVTGYLDVVAPESYEGLTIGLGLLPKVMEDRLVKETQQNIYSDIEAPLTPILAKMETLGIRANRSAFRDFSKLLEGEIARVQEKVYELAGETFLISSPKQLGEILFTKLQIPGAQKTKTGYATGVEVLGELADTYDIAREVLNWRELSKLKSTYADSLEKLIGDDGRIHTTYNQTGAATGRISSNDPNLQNIPIRTELGRPIRRAFEADGGFVLASLDYSQIELRVLAHLCGEPALVSAFQNHEDVHSVTAQSVFNLGTEEPTKEQRRLAKMLNYAVLYGVTGHGLARQLGPKFSMSEAAELIKQYNERFPSVHDFTKGIVKEARAKGFTTTMCGRRRYFHDIHAARMQERQSAERQAMNAPIQGAAADMLKIAMIEVDALLKGSSARMLLTVHDELVFEIPPAEIESLMPKIALKMETALPLTVPVEVDGKQGKNWDEMSKLKL